MNLLIIDEDGLRKATHTEIGKEIDEDDILEIIEEWNNDNYFFEPQEEYLRAIIDKCQRLIESNKKLNS